LGHRDWTNQVTTSFAIKRRGAAVVGEAHRLVFSSRTPGLRVLTYHAVGNPVDGDINGIYTLTPGAFAAQIDRVVATAQHAGLPIVSFTSPVDNGIAITFDDGYADLLSVVLPEMTQRQLPFHVFITADKLTSGDPRYLTTSNLQLLTQSTLVTVGAHGARHRPLTNLDDAQCLADLRASREQLSNVIGRDVDTMSYPFGLVNQAVRNNVAAAGFTKAASSKWGFNDHQTDPLMMRRIDMWARDSGRTVANKVLGHWNWFCRLK
jgi:peptidoglycan/xylan/chitin deacetylase (PgdA/CDA1 family)